MSSLRTSVAPFLHVIPFPPSSPFPAGIALALACLTRYEAWPVTAAALAAAVVARWRRGADVRAAARSVARIAIYPAATIAAFTIFSRVVIGEWFVAGGFFVPENKALGDPRLAAAEIWYGTHMLSGYLLVVLGGFGAALAVALAVADRRRAHALVAVALLATAALPWVAFFKGHPFRIRYMVPLVAMEAVGAGILAGLLRRAHVAAALVLAAITAYELRPLDAAAPMVAEAQWDSPNAPERARVTACLERWRQGEKIMASMGSLGHYMQEASSAGFQIRDFLHEGNGDLWHAAFVYPSRYVDWILIEEKAEGGDELAQNAREHPEFLDGFARVCEGAGLALYRRTRR